MNKRVLILHGWNGSAYPHWQAILAQDLEKEGYEVSFPTLPNKDLPKLEEWKTYIKKEIEGFNPNIVVCHSLGCITWFHIADEIDIDLDKLMLVAPVQQECDIKEIDTFFPYPVPKDLKSKEAIIAASDNDPYMSLTQAIDLQQKLNVGMKIMNNAGHINAESGYGKLDCALDWIKRVVE